MGYISGHEAQQGPHLAAWLQRSRTETSGARSAGGWWPAGQCGRAGIGGGAAEGWLTGRATACPGPHGAVPRWGGLRSGRTTVSVQTRSAVRGDAGMHPDPAPWQAAPPPAPWLPELREAGGHRGAWSSAPCAFSAPSAAPSAPSVCPRAPWYTSTCRQLPGSHGGPWQTTAALARGWGWTRPNVLAVLRGSRCRASLMCPRWGCPPAGIAGPAGRGRPPPSWRSHWVWVRGWAGAGRCLFKATSQGRGRWAARGSGRTSTSTGCEPAGERAPWPRAAS